MVNVNKNIVPGKQAESSAKTEPQAQARRPRNTALNSSKKLPDSIKNRRKQKLNCSREQVIDQLVNEEQIYTPEEAEELVSSFEKQTGATVERLATTDEIDNYDGEFWATKDGVTQLWCRGNDGWYAKEEDYESDGSLGVELADKSDIDSACGNKTDADSSLNCEAGSAKVSGTVTIYNDFADLDNDTTERLLRSRIEKAVPGAKVDFEKVNDTDVKVNIDCPDADAEKARLAVESSDVTKSVDWESATKELDSSKDADKTAESTNLNSSTEPEGDTDGGESVSEGVDASDIKITTESGNEVSMQDIKIVQNPDTNELAIFIPEDEDETIPEGFSVIGMVVPDTLSSATAIEGGEVCPECGQDPCVCEGAEDGEELDSSKKKNELNCSSSSGLLEVATEYYEDEHDALVDILQSVDNLGYGDAVYEQLIKNYGYEGTDAQQADDALIKMASEDADEHDFLVSLIQAIEDLGYGKQVYTDVLGIGGDIDSSLNCDSSKDDYFAALWSAYTDDDYKCACCGKSFPAGHNSVQLDGHKPDGMHFIYKYTEDNRVGNSVNYDPYNLPPEDSEGGIFKVVVGEEADDEGYRWLNFCRNCWPKLTSKSPEEIYNEYSVAENKNELTQESVNSSLGGGDDRQDATSQVTVPKSFPDDKVHDLYRWVENELLHEGIDVDVYGVGRPSASTISFEFEVTGRDPSEVDAIIEDRVKEFIANGNNAIQYPEGDPRSELNSEKHEKNLNCKVENARVEPTEQGTWVVRADTDRFGKDAILYEHYSEEGANKYLDRLKAGGDAVANGYDGHIDPKKVDLDSGNGIAEAKLDKASISKAMSKVLTEDKDTPLVSINLKDGILVYLQPASYDDNRLIEDGNFDEAKIYVAMYDENFNPIMVNDRRENKMNGSEVVDYIKHNLGM